MGESSTMKKHIFAADNGDCTYTLSPGQVFICLVRRRGALIFALGAVFLLAALGAVLWMHFYKKSIDAGTMTASILVVVVIQTALEGLAFGALFLKARKVCASHGGATTLEWDAVNVAVCKGGANRRCAWAELSCKMEKDCSATVFFPDGEEVWLLSPPLSEEALDVLKQRLQLRSKSR